MSSLQEDNNGFVQFPINDSVFNRKDGKTIIYLVAFDSSGFSNTPYVLSNLNVNLPGVQMSQEHIDFVRNINL